VRQLSAILRLAVALDRRNKGAIAGVKCDYDSNHHLLNFQIMPTEIGDKCSLELWNLSYKKEAFEEEFDVKLQVTISEKLPTASLVI